MLFAIGCGLRLYYVLTAIADGDELSSYLSFASRKLSFCLSNYDPNNHPLNSLLVHMTTRAFGNSLPVIRIWVFVCGVAAMPLIYVIIRKIYNKEAAILGVALTASSFALVLYSSTARGYSLQVCLYLLLILVAIRIKETGKGWVWFVIIISLGFYALITFLYFVAGVFLWLLISAWRNDTYTERSVFIKKLVFYTALAAVATGILYTPFILQSGLNSIIDNSISKSLALSDFIRNTPGVISGTYRFWSYDVRFFIYPILFAGFALSIILNKKISRAKANLPLAVLIGAVLVFVAQRRIPFSRVSVPFLPLFFGCASAGLYFVVHSLLDRVRTRRSHVVRPYYLSLLSVGLAVILLIMVFPGVSYHGNKPFLWEYPGMNYPTIARLIKSRLHEDDLVCSNLLNSINLTYYFEREGIPLEHLYKNLKEVRTLPPADVKRVLIVTDLGYGSLASTVEDCNLEFNSSLVSSESWYNNDRRVAYSLFQIMVIPLENAK